ncbi:hypothetical protein P153DRAFT_148521 [Dothidotthia symphoricarpi CBS 119687]|uniref:Uncharacterized protein n=1 Tax=Dothidotthia symphoricarpi CBS 119687 TaxID=1392245 RepID=A0A6A5ZXI2_9PLEO|nr:uncharacterized protein P153DRAFT_148521 [Dothidotthia symphoricarpi CBS 119687]KAF2123613.1 hypothetical protein P153DRAFT_148521 [Dothidotthia symphoricarpi CBS 119687]
MGLESNSSGRGPADSSTLLTPMHMELDKLRKENAQLKEDVAREKKDAQGWMKLYNDSRQAISEEEQRLRDALADEETLSKKIAAHLQEQRSKVERLEEDVDRYLGTNRTLDASLVWKNEEVASAIQLHDVQGQNRILTEERDDLEKKYEELRGVQSGTDRKRRELEIILKDVTVEYRNLVQSRSDILMNLANDKALWLFRILDKGKEPITFKKHRKHQLLRHCVDTEVSEGFIVALILALHELQGRGDPPEWVDDEAWIELSNRLNSVDAKKSTDDDTLTKGDGDEQNDIAAWIANSSLAENVRNQFAIQLDKASFTELGYLPTTEPIKYSQALDDFIKLDQQMRRRGL